MSSTQFSAATDVGLRRTNNEDTILSNPQAGLWLVADGMGGHAAGEVASAIAAETVEKEIGRGQSLRHAIQQAHQAVLRAADAGIGGAGMGSTIVALHSHGMEYDVAWVGDSRAYLWQPRATPKSHASSQVAHGASDGNKGELIQLTTDHSYVQMLFDSGAISAAEMQQHPDKNIITQCLGSTEVGNLSVDTCRMRWYPDDWVLLCSDGLSDAVSDEQIGELLAEQTNIENATRALVNLALEHGGNDNISVSIVACPGALQRTWQTARGHWRRWQRKLGI